MKNIRKWLIRIGIVLLVIVIVLAGVGTWFVRRPWTQDSGTIKVPGLLASVEIIRDQWGVPHIYAQNEHDLFFAQGYVHAQDRLWQMETSRRLSSGTFSAILGEQGLWIDPYMRTVGLRRVAERVWTEMDDDCRTILESYAKGVNAYIEMHRNRLPLEFAILGVDPEPWTPIDTLVWGGLMADDTHHGADELGLAEIVALLGEEAARRLMWTSDQDIPIIVPSEAGSYDWLRHAGFKQKLASLSEWLGDLGLGWASNNWVVHGSQTATGKPILANDTHLNLMMPSYWYENGLHGGRFDSVGFTIPGVPLVVVGHNQHIAWGITNLRADDQDYYIERLDDLENPTQYEFMGEWQDLEFVRETIEVKGLDPVTLEIPFTHHGPIVNMEDVSESSDEKPLALGWTFYECNTILKSIVLLNSATNWDDFHAALQYWDALGLNFVYADVEGNIGYQAAGRVPIRPPEHQGILPVPGWTGEYEWQGFIPFDAMPSVFNPPVGFIATANNKVVPDDYPYLLAREWPPCYRARRINELLSTGDHFTVKDMQDIQSDTYLVPAKALRPYLLAIEPEDDLQAEVLALLEAWDLRYEADCVGASINAVWHKFIVQNTIGDELGDEWLDTLSYRAVQSIFTRSSWITELMANADDAWFDDVNTPEVETRDDIVCRSLTDAVDWLSEKYGKNPDRWEWGRLHAVTFFHLPLGSSGVAPLERLFNGRTIPARGDYKTVNMAGHSWSDQSFEVLFGTTQRMIVDLNDWDSMLAVNSTGQSEHLFHPHREDQISMWQNVEYRSMPFTREAVEANAEATLNLTPQ